MNSILATDAAPAATDEKPNALPPLETQGGNEHMRHIPGAEWMARKVESDIRKRVDDLLRVFADISAADPRHSSYETELRALCKALERLSDIAKPAGRHNGHGDLSSRIDALLSQCAAALHSLEPTPFGRRNPYNGFDRSKAEPVYGALLSVLCHVDRLITLARGIDPGIDERLLSGLVVLANPVDERMLQPIA